ncbi:ATP-binding protein [Sporofaciens sp. SGI.106]|uniref:ATP-binding protein n=1 Tax=Sporofaciens sp. SGI.106 TaxID=3420568 RepID=UPI003D05A5C4
MQERKQKTKYLLPVVFALILVVSLVLGIVFMRNSLMKLTVEERSNQLKEMVTQIKANLTSGLQTHWNLVEGLNNAVQGQHFENRQELCDNIAHLEKVFCTDMYGSQVMLLDEQGTAYLRNGPVGIWNDVSHLIDENSRHTFISETDNIDGCFLVFSRELDSPVTMGDDNVRFTHVVLLKDIKTVKQYYTTTTYGGSAATYFIRKNGTLAYFDADEEDVIDARNIFKSLGEVEYVQEQSFDMVKEQLDREGIATANILLNQTEYYYCLTALDDYDMILMLLIPADSVAVSTMNMMESTIRTAVIFILAMALLLLLAVISFIRVRRSSQMVRVEQETNRELNQLRMVAESANAAKSTFLNNMSHDIRTPMNAIIGFTNIAMKHSPPPEIKNCLDKISESSEHLLALINDVLDISRIESGKIKYTPTPVDIAEVTDSVLTIMYGYLSNRNITFRTELEEPETRYVLTDAVRVREVLVNILGNAVKFTEDGGTVTYTVSYHPGKDDHHINVRYRISDTGIGMAEGFVGHIFDEFSQEEHGARTQYKGTGLGMAITKRYVDLMGGTISVESKKGIGSTFTVELPMEITDACEVKKKNYSVGNIDLTGLKILLAEDNDLNAEIAIVQLEELGIQITRAADGDEAARFFAENPQGTFDLILMDVMMPKMNGYEATKAIRTLQNRPDADTIPIIAMTANAFAEDVQASLDAGMNGHLSKPIVIDEVVKTIARNLDR